MKERIIKYLTYIVNKLKNKAQDNTKSISSLAPKILIEKEELERIAPYTNRLKDAIDTKGITNIALTGGYGSGKSTILNTFQDLYPDYEYINISLASFKDNKQDNPKENDDLDRQLEISILQQLFYHVRPSTIPDSRFKRIINLTSKRLFLFSFCLIIWVLSAFSLFRFGYIENLNPSTWDLSKSFSWTTLLSSIIFFSGIGSFCRILIRLFINSKINKLNIKGEVELGNDIDKSVFNEHLEEIIYFFQRTKYNVVIIEDLDRFNNTDIFTKLREINILLNKSELINREINFIYAIRDEMFTDKTERVKFFEYIIPVIPFINPSNAGEQLAKLIKESKLEGVLSKDFTEDVVTFIDDIDMRLLTNIFHEYVLYKDSLKEINQNNLFAIITYKNIFPEDFGKLHKRDGYLYKLLTNKDKYIIEITAEDKKNIIKKECEIENIQNETFDNILELKSVYINAILTKSPDISLFIINDNEVDFSEITKDKYFNILLESTDIQYICFDQYYYHKNYNGSTGYSFNSVEKEINSNFTYKEREQFIKSRSEGKINKLKEEVSELKNKIATIESKSLTEIFQEIDIDNFIKDTPINIPLIRNLLLNGYINENYNDYISIFHGINMTSQDFSFIRKVKSGVRQIFNEPLTNIDQIIKKLPIRYFRNEVILNFNLLDYLLKNNLTYEEQYKSIIDLIKKETDHSLKFMDEYISTQSEMIPFFIQELSTDWTNFWDYINNYLSFEYQKKDNYLFLILIHAKLDSIYSLNKSLRLTYYIEKHNDFISLFRDKDHLDKVTSVINELNIHLEELKLPNGENDELFKYIYENDYYYINVHNITLLLNKLYEGHSEGVACWNYTTILNSDCEPLKRYIQKFLINYLENVFLKLPNNTNESEDTLLKLLNDSNIKLDMRVDILKKQETKITDINNVEDKLLYYQIYLNDKIIPRWGNIINYSLKQEALITFLNIEENYQALNEEDVDRTDQSISDFTKKLFFANSLSIGAYKALMEKAPYVWSSIDFSSLDLDKVEWLIENKLALSKNNYNTLKLHFPTISFKLIEKKRSELMTKYNELKLNIDDHIKILRSTIIDRSTKEKIISQIDNEWFFENDTLNMLIQNVLCQSSKDILSYEALYAIVRYSTNNDKRLQLIYNHIVTLSNDQVQTLITMLGGEYKKIFMLKKQKTFDYSLTKNRLFEELKSRKMINSYKLTNDKNKIKVVALYK